MTPTDSLRARLRKLLNEVVPVGGVYTDTQFSDAEIDELLTEAHNIWGAAATGWTMKAGMLEARIECYNVGQERYELTSLRDQLSFALFLADRYTQMAKGAGGSVIVRLTKPGVL